MKKTFVVALLISIVFSACSNKESEKTPLREKIDSEFLARNVSVGMTMEEIKSAETLAFTLDTKTSFYEENYTLEYLESDDTVDYNGYPAIVTYEIYNGIMIGLTYDLLITYDSFDSDKKTSYDVFKEFQSEYTHSFGNPSDTDSKFSSLYNTYSSSWDENNFQKSYSISLYTIDESQSSTNMLKPTTVTDKVSITFRITGQ